MEWHQLTADAALGRIDSRPDGLTASEVEARLARFGPNQLVDRGGRTIWNILLEQLKSVMVIVLIVAGVISLALGELTDAAAILTIVVLNAILGVMQEYRAEGAMQALKSLAVPVVRVRRDEHLLEISARDLVPGDVVLLEAGSHVPADGRLLEAVNLRLQEAALTGESEPVEKYSEPVTGTDVALGDRRNMVYMGTAVVAGRGAQLVTETGMRTELGRIAEMLQSVHREPTPLQKRLEQLAKGLAVAALVVVAIVFGLGMLRGEPFRLMFMVAISMAVAAVPEGLPAVVTIALTLGARRMLARKALVRRLNAVETLGSVTVICSDKTGTLTENRMTVTELDVAGHRLDVTPDMELGSAVLGCERAPALTLLLAGGALCNDAALERDDAGRMQVVGDPTLRVVHTTPQSVRVEPLHYQPTARLNWTEYAVDTSNFVNGNPAIGCSQGHIRLVFDSGRIVRADNYFSSFDGSAFTRPESVAWEEYYDLFPACCTDAAGRFWMAWQSFRDYSSSSYEHFQLFSTYYYNGAWSSVQRVGPIAGYHDMQAAIASGTDTVVWCAFKSWRNGQADIWVSSENNGGAWATPSR